MEPNAPDFDELDAALDKFDTEVPASEIHGTLTGLLCVNVGAGPDIWQKNLWPHLPEDDLLINEALAVFNRAHDATRRQLNDPTCDFQLLLPDDESPLAERVNALGDWCQGFLIGLSLGGIKDFAALPENAKEIASDLLEIARAGTSYELGETEEDENAYAELLEYIRVGILLINEEVQPTQAPPLTDENIN
jgi:yecA family protein